MAINPAEAFGSATTFSNTGPYVERETPMDLPVRLKSYSERQILSFVQDRIWGAVNATNFRAQVDNWPKLHRAYSGQFRDTNIPKWRSQLYVNLSFKAVETLKAYMQDAIFSNPPYITIDGGMPEYCASAKNLQKLMDYELYHTKFEQRMMDALTMTLKYGTCPVKSYWRYYIDYDHTKDFQRKGLKWIDKGMNNKGKAYAKWDDPWFVPLDSRKVYPDPLARYTDELRYVTEEYTIDLDQLHKDKERCGYFNLENLKNSQAGYSLYGKHFTMLNDIYPRNQWNARRDENRREVFISEYWGRLDLPGNQDDPRIYRVMIANNYNLISVRPNPYGHGDLPYQFLNIIGKEEEIYGVSAIEKVLTDNYVMNALVNMRVDSMQFFINPRLLVRRGALADKHSIEWTRPGEIINVNATGDLDQAYRQLALQDTGMNSFRDQLNYHTQHAEETMAINPNAAGAMGRSGRSATEASQAMAGANVRFNSMVKQLKFSGFDGLMRHYGQLCQQYVNERHFPILHPQTNEEKNAIMQVMKKDIAGEMFYRVLDNTSTNKDIRTQLITNMLGVLAPFAQTLQMDFKPLIKGLLELSPVAGELNLDQLFPQDQTPEIMGQENSQLERMANMQAPPGMEGQAGMANPNSPAMNVGGNPGVQAVAEQMGGAGGLF